MKQKQPIFVTEAVFRAEIADIRNHMATKSDIARLSLEIIKTQQDVREIKQVMATKDDINRVLDIVTDLAKNTHLVLQNQEIHRGYIHNHEARLIDLEKRLPH